MNTIQGVKANERMAAVMRAGNTWSLNVVLYGLLIDIMYRALVWHEAAWDLFALLFASGFISLAHAARHKVQILNRNNVMVMSLPCHHQALLTKQATSSVKLLIMVMAWIKPLKKH